MSGCVRRGEYRGGAPKGERARSAETSGNIRSRGARRAPLGTASKYAPFGAPPPFIYLGRLDGLSCSGVKQNSDAIAASRERGRLFASPRVRGEVEERSDEDEGASPRFSEPLHKSGGASDIAAILHPAAKPPHPTLSPECARTPHAQKIPRPNDLYAMAAHAVSKEASAVRIVAQHQSLPLLARLRRRTLPPRRAPVRITNAIGGGCKNCRTPMRCRGCAKRPSLAGYCGKAAQAPRGECAIERRRQSGSHYPPPRKRGGTMQAWRGVGFGLLLASYEKRRCPRPSHRARARSSSPLSRGGMSRAQCTTIVVLSLPSRSTRPNRMAALPGSSRTQPCDTGRPSPEIS